MPFRSVFQPVFSLLSPGWPVLANLRYWPLGSQNVTMWWSSTRPRFGVRRSNPATYSGALDAIRKAFAKAHRVKPGLFSSNSVGACPECKGAGVIYLDFGFMLGQSAVCGACQGRRFNHEVLGYLLGDKNIADVL